MRIAAISVTAGPSGWETDGTNEAGRWLGMKRRIKEEGMAVVGAAVKVI